VCKVSFTVGCRRPVVCAAAGQKPDNIIAHKVVIINQNIIISDSSRNVSFIVMYLFVNNKYVKPV